jgi:hypothetical protein
MVNMKSTIFTAALLLILFSISYADPSGESIKARLEREPKKEKTRSGIESEPPAPIPPEVWKQTEKGQSEKPLKEPIKETPPAGKSYIIKNYEEGKRYQDSLESYEYPPEEIRKILDQ